MSLAILAPLVILALLFAKRQWGQRLANPKRLPYPPGPRPLPVVGNLFDTPTEYDWLTYSDWAKKYGKFFGTLEFALVIDRPRL